jgi:hypothetical protein
VRRPARARLLLAAGLGLALEALAVPRAAQAEPQGNAALTLGVAAVGSEGQFWDHAEFHLGARGDVLFGRSDSSDFGAGPYLEVGTLAFDEFQFGGGGSLLLPVDSDFPLVASAGMFGRIGDDEWGLEPGVAGALFWGARNYNFHSSYGMAGGITVGYRHCFGESQETALLVAVHADLAFIALPFVMLIDLMRGPSDEVAPVEPSR